MFSSHQSLSSFFWGSYNLNPDFFLLEINGNLRETLGIDERNPKE